MLTGRQNLCLPAGGDDTQCDVGGADRIVSRSAHEHGVLDKEELAASPEIKLYPGMPATVMVTTKERTALDYLAGPLVASFDRSFRQK